MCEYLIVDWQFGIPATLACAALVLVVGRRLIERVAFLRKYSIPNPSSAVCWPHCLSAVLHSRRCKPALRHSLQPGLMLAFFATIGLGADARMLTRGGVALVLFTRASSACW